MTSEGNVNDTSQTPSNDRDAGSTTKHGETGKSGSYNNKGKSGSKFKSLGYFDVSNKDFEGDTPDIGCVLGLRSEKISRKVQFDTFREKLEDYLTKNLTSPMEGYEGSVQ